MMENDVLSRTYEELKTSDYPIFIWGAGVMSKKVERRLSEQNIEIAGFFVDGGYACTGNSKEGAPIYSLDELRERNNIINVVIGHGHYEKRDEISELPFIHKVYIIANPYLQYRSVGIGEWIERNEPIYDEIMKGLADDQSRSALYAYCMVNETNDIEYLMRDEFMVRDMFDFEGLQLTDRERFVDVGAWTGDTINLFKKKTGGAYDHIFAVEPDPRNLRKLKENIQGKRDISIYSCGLGSEAGDFYLDVDKESSQSTSLSERKTEEEQIRIQVRTLDEMFENETFSLLKVFVPFTFLEILQGGKKCLLRYKPRVIANISAEGGTKFFDAIKWMQELDVGYRLALRYDMAMPTRLTLYAY